MGMRAYNYGCLINVSMNISIIQEICYFCIVEQKSVSLSYSRIRFIRHFFLYNFLMEITFVFKQMKNGLTALDVSCTNTILPCSMSGEIKVFKPYIIHIDNTNDALQQCKKFNSVIYPSCILKTTCFCHIL